MLAELRQMGAEVRCMREGVWTIGCDSDLAAALTQLPYIRSVVRYSPGEETHKNAGHKAGASPVLDGCSLVGHIEDNALARKAEEPGQPTGHPIKYLVGNVVVNVFFLAHNSDTWTDDKQELALNEINQGLADPDLSGPDFGVATFYNYNFNCNLTFEVIAGGEVLVSREPIEMNALEVMQAAGQIAGQWGYEEGLGGIAQFNAEQRTSRGADAAFSVFVIDDTSDEDHRLEDGRYAFVPMVGGPYMVLTLHNGDWGVDRFNRVFVHELHHIFGAADEYRGSGASIEATSGYLAVVNGNAQTDSPLNDFACVMRDPDTGKVCPFTLGQVGVLLPGTRGDGVPDAIQFPPGSRQKQSQFTIQVGSWIEQDGNMDGILDPAERGALTLKVVNDSQAAMRDVELQIVPSRGWVEGPSTVVRLGSISGPGVYDAGTPLAANLELGDGVLPGDTVELETTLRTGQGWTFADTVILTVSKDPETATVYAADASADELDQPGLVTALDGNGVDPASVIETEADLLPKGAFGCGALGLLPFLSVVGLMWAAGTFGRPRKWGLRQLNKANPRRLMVGAKPAMDSSDPHHAGTEIRTRG